LAAEEGWRRCYERLPATPAERAVAELGDVLRTLSVTHGTRDGAHHGPALVVA